MIKIIGISVLVPVFLLGFFMIAKGQNPLKYRYLFRNIILSKSQQYELAAVLRGRVYYPRYFYVPSKKQYIVYSNVDETGPFRFYSMQSKAYGKDYAFLNGEGVVIQHLETPLRFSVKSACFYGAKTYIPWLESGKTDAIPYDKVHNDSLKLDREAFNQLFRELYKTADYVEFVNLRDADDSDHQAGVIFRRAGKVEILLSGLRNSHMHCNSQRNEATNNFEDYYTLAMHDSEAYPESAPLLQMHALQTTDTNPFVYWRHRFKKPFRITKYHSEYSSGWQGIMKLHGIPIYVPGDGSGTAYVRFSVNNDVFRVKLPDVDKSNVFPLYNLGLRKFELPANLSIENSLVFMESSQNSGENRLGGGVYVVRKSSTANPSADIPFGITEAHFNTLPINLQEALMHPDSTTELIIQDGNITKWIPEIAYLKNLTRLEFSTSIDEVPDEIARLPKLHELVMKTGTVSSVSPKIAELTQLEDLSLFSSKLTKFPTAILQLKNLKRLNIGASEIAELPANIDQLKELEYLSMTSTNIRTLPESMIAMKKLYVDDSQDLEEKLPEAYKHLFDYTKLPSRW